MIDMDYQAEIDKNIKLSASVYLRRQELEGQLQTIQMQIRQTEAVMLRLDGKIELLEELKSQQVAPEDKVVSIVRE